MASITIQHNGEQIEFPTKKKMLKQMGRAILSGSDAPMTLRQLYYRFVGFDLIENKQSQYQYLSESIKEARIEGLIPWDWIEDRTRGTQGGDTGYLTPRARFRRNLNWFENTANRHVLPRWQGQDDYVEVWVEKEALAGVFADVCDPLNVVTFPCRGYSSITMIKDAADRFGQAVENDRRPYIEYFGDFDPTGKDIERNVRETLRGTFGIDVTVDRVALTREQIDEFELPPQPAKSTDARYESFVDEHGNMAVELDALPPEELRDLVRESVDKHFDDDHYATVVEPRQADERESIRGHVTAVIDRDGSDWA